MSEKAIHLKNNKHVNARRKISRTKKYFSLFLLLLAMRGVLTSAFFLKSLRWLKEVKEREDEMGGGGGKDTCKQYK